MKANELRIGNFVYVENYKSHPNLINEPVKVVGIQQRQELAFPKSEASISIEVDKYNGVSQFNEFINPIPLTEEWFLNFDFEKLTDKNKGFKQSCYVNKTGFKLYLNFDDGKMTLDFILGINYEYVHQLQNIYFYLTNKELTCNQP